jgi:hypothetical protein
MFFVLCICSFQHDSWDTGSILKVDSLGHVLYGFVNGEFVGKLLNLLQFFNDG